MLVVALAVLLDPIVWLAHAFRHGAEEQQEAQRIALAEDETARTALAERIAAAYQKALGQQSKRTYQAYNASILSLEKVKAMDPDRVTDWPPKIDESIRAAKAKLSDLARPLREQGLAFKAKGDLLKSREAYSKATITNPYDETLRREHDASHNGARFTNQRIALLTDETVHILELSSAKILASLRPLDLLTEADSKRIPLSTCGRRWLKSATFEGEALHIRVKEVDLLFVIDAAGAIERNGEVRQP